ncbi:MAG: BamA/TamA family outer membrane protein [Deltaproteobacteria bacterium]|nr:BamA/TamA family outer membrane protein [Deltaproteobacteria bacterium]
MSTRSRRASGTFVGHAALASTLVGAALSLGCPAKLPQGATALDKIEIKGTDEIDTDDREGAIASEETSKVLGLFRAWWVDYALFDAVTLEKDLQRIERFYQARGHYEARVRAGRVIRTGDRSVRVQIVVDEGPVVRLARVQVSGLEGLPADVRKKFGAAWKAAPGDPFDEEHYRASGAAAEQLLTDEGYAHATVTLGADVDLVKHEAVIHVEVAAGPRCTFGKISVIGLSQLPENRVRRIVAIEPGDEYSTRAMRGAQNALFDLGTFDTINFEPDLSDPNATVIPVKISVTEAKLRRIKAGPGFLVDPLRNDVHVTASWEHRNFFGGLRNFRVELRPMLITRGGFFSVSGAHPGILATSELRQPAFIESRTNGVLGLTGGVLPDPINDYRTVTAMGTVGVDRRFAGILFVGLFYRKALQFASPTGGTVLPPNVFDATLGYVELLQAIDARDDLLDPKRGWFGSLSLQYAFGGDTLWGGDFGDVRLQPEIRMYGPLARTVILAFRFTTGWLLPYDYDVREPARRTPTADDPSRYAHESRSRDQRFDATGATPAWRAFYSGGALGNRGYATRQIGLRDCREDVVEGRLVQAQRGMDCSVVVGGASLWETSLELRFVISGPLAGVLFVDASDVSRRRFDLRLDYPHLSVGPGLRYNTPVGPVRVDFGVRVPGAQRIGGDLDPRETAKDFNLGFKGPYALHFSLGQAF